MMLQKWKVFALALVAVPMIAFAAGMPSRPKFQGVTVTAAGATTADLFVTQTGAAANERIYRFRNNGAGQLQLCSLNDALSVANCFAVVDRTGAVNDSLTLTATTIDLVGKPVVTGAFAEKIKLNAMDSVGDNYISGYSSDGTTVRWYMGNGAANDNDVHVNNSVSGSALQLTTTGGGAVLVNGQQITGPALSGTYTPTITNVLNSSGGTAVVNQWMRVGDTVTVSGRVDGSASGAGSFQFGISLPIASATTLGYQISGVASAVSGVAGDRAGSILGDAANDRATLTSVATGAGSVGFVYTFTYQVI